MDKFHNELREIVELNGYSYDYVLNLPRVEYKDAYMLYHKSFWDRPLSGICSFGGKRYFFRVAVEIEEVMIDSIMESYKGTSEIIYVLEELSEEAWKIEDEVHAKFTKYVGKHTEYNSEGRRQLGANGLDHTVFFDWYAGLDPDKKDLKGTPKFRVHAGDWSYGPEPEE